METKDSVTYDVFLPGELIDLCVPSEKAAIVSGWHNWFNNQETTRFLNQGIFPNTVEEQCRFYNQNAVEKKRVILMIRAKGETGLMGTISLSNIDMFTRQANLAIVIGAHPKKPNYYALEAVCRMTEHAFENVGVTCIHATMLKPLKTWCQMTELFGYKVEGIQRKNFTKGYHVYDTIVTSCLLDDYLGLKAMRNGQLWPGAKKVNELVHKMPKQCFSDKVCRMLEEEQKRYYGSLKYL